MRVSVRGASIAFGAFTVFSGVDAEFPQGRVTALVGPSGSGKSSLLAAIAGYQHLAAGTIALHSPPGAPRAPSPHVVAWVPQGSNALGRRTVLDNVLIASLATGSPRDEAREVAVDALAQVGLADRLTEQARRLSGGELQRVAVARALASGKELILADEPSANLDGANTEELAATLHRLVSRATIIVATHDPILVAAADGAVHLRQEVRAHG